METTETSLAIEQATSRRIPHFNKQNAREYQRKAVESRQHNIIAEKVAEQNEKLGLANEPRIALVERELARVAKMMSETEDVDSYQKLSAARARLFTEWQVLSGTPNPGSAPRGRKAPRIQIEPIQPIQPASEPPKAG